MTTNRSRKNKMHIDNEQAASVEEHYFYIINNDEPIDSKFTEVSPKDLPEWYNPELFKRGQEYYKSNKLSILISGLMGLALVLCVPLVKKVLTFTNQTSTACSAFTRYLETVLHTHNMYISNIEDETSKFWKSVNVIRWKHSNASRRCLSNKIPGINQQSMVLTQFGFMGFIMIEPKQLGVTDEAKYREGICHYWRVLGHLLGIPPKMNICRKNDKETTELCRLVNDRYYKKALEENPLEENQLWATMIEGCDYIVSLNRNLFLKFANELVGLPYNGPLTFMDRIFIHQILFDLLRTPYIGFILRKIFNFYLPLQLWILEHYPIGAVLKFGVAKCKINLYPNVKS